MSCSANNYNNNGDNNNNNNNNNNGGISEVCEDLYEQAVKCEKNVAGATYKDTSGCEMIHIILQNEVAAWTFGIGGFALAGYLFMLNKKVGEKS